METYVVEIQTKDGQTHSQVIDLNLEQIRWIKEGLELGITVPLYITTKEKKRFGDSIIGDILSIKKQ